MRFADDQNPVAIAKQVVQRLQTGWQDTWSNVMCRREHDDAVELFGGTINHVLIDDHGRPVGDFLNPTEPPCAEHGEAVAATVVASGADVY